VENEDGKGFSESLSLGSLGLPLFLLSIKMHWYPNHWMLRLAPKMPIIYIPYYGGMVSEISLLVFQKMALDMASL
jgi:hypothetical protein